MPAFIGPFVGFALGAALAWLGRREAERASERSAGARAAVAALFGALVVAPVCAYFLVFAPDWAFAYLVDARRVPSAVDLLLVLLDAGLVVVGFVAAERALRRRARRALTLSVAIPMALALALALAFLPKLRREGTYHQVRSDFGTQPVAGSPLGYAILWMNAMLVVGFALSVRSLADRPRPQSPSAPPMPEQPSSPTTPSVRAPMLGRRSHRR